VILEDLPIVCKELRDAGIDYIVVGGAAIERKYPIGTGDIDVVIALRDYPAVLKKLIDHPGVRNLEDVGTMAGCQFRVGTHWTDVEFINPKLFCGRKPPDDFVRYVARFRSQETEVGRVAHPEIVWYMRLAVPDWTIYVQKILRDVKAGVPQSLVDKVLEIAEHFENVEQLEPRVRRAKELIEMLVR
jgi:hypothetical protein